MPDFILMSLNVIALGLFDIGSEVFTLFLLSVLSDRTLINVQPCIGVV